MVVVLYLTKPITRANLLKVLVLALAPMQEEVQTVSSHSHKPLLGLKLLVVEDNVVNQMVARGLLEQSGARVEIAVGGR